VFHTSFGVNSVSLSSVFRDVNVNEFDDIVSDGGGEDCGERDFFGGSEIFGVAVKDRDLS
jgi:hypothetical protein